MRRFSPGVPGAVVAFQQLHRPGSTTCFSTSTGYAVQLDVRDLDSGPLWIVDEHHVLQLRASGAADVPEE